jgi:hypothetical protein
VRAAGRSLCAVLDVPTYKYDVPYVVGVARRRGISEEFLELSKAQALQQYRVPEHEFLELQRLGMLRTVDLKDSLCRGDRCVYEAQGDLLYEDFDHLTIRGALFVASALEECFRDIPPFKAN